MALNRLMLNSDPTAGRQAIFLGATEPRAARPRKEPAARRCSVGQGRLAVSISSMRFVILMFFRLAMKTSLCRLAGLGGSKFSRRCLRTASKEKIEPAMDADPTNLVPSTQVHSTL